MVAPSSADDHLDRDVAYQLEEEGTGAPGHGRAESDRHSMLQPASGRGKHFAEGEDVVPDKVDTARQLFPHCLVWTPIPVLTWLLPFIGHMGIGDKRGVIYDFAGPYFIGSGELSFGRPTRYLQLDLSKCREDWDQGVICGCEDYSKRMHNLFCDNCHSHVAHCLNLMSYDGFHQYNMVILCFWFFFKAKYTSTRGCLYTWLPFLIILTIALAIHYAK